MSFRLLQPINLISTTNLHQTVKSKFRNIRKEHLKSIKIQISYCLRNNQKKLYRDLLSSGFISNFKNIRQPGTFKCNDKRCKICSDYSHETDTFTISNGLKFGKFPEKLTVT